MALKLVTPPAAEPLTPAEAKAHLRVDTADEDAYIGAVVAAARRHVEKELWRALLTQVWRLSLRGFPAGAIAVPRPPLQSVTEIVYVDPAGVEQTLGPAAYQVNADCEPGEIEPAAGTSWPDTADRPRAVRVTFVAGYGDAAADVPPNIVQALRLVVGHFYEHREAVITGTTATVLPLAVGALLAGMEIRDRRLPPLLAEETG